MTIAATSLLLQPLEVERDGHSAVAKDTHRRAAQRLRVWTVLCRSRGTSEDVTPGKRNTTRFPRGLRQMPSQGRAQDLGRGRRWVRVDYHRRGVGVTC